MNINIEEWLIVALYCDVAPEFRVAQNMFDEAYSGPEQRRRVQHRLNRDSSRIMRSVDTKHPDTALAA